MRVRVMGLATGERAVVGGAAGEDERPIPGAACGVRSLLELGVPFASLGLEPGEAVALLVQTFREGQPLESYPGEEGLTFAVPGPDFEAAMWNA